MMERRNDNGGCCFEPRYGGGGQTQTGQQQQAWQMGKIMLKFRPIAPKPAAMAAPAPVPAVGPAVKGRKRKAVAGKRGRKPKKAAAAATTVAATQMVQKEAEKDKSSSSRSSSSSGMTSVDSSPPPPPEATTLPLMPVPLVEVAAVTPVVPDIGVAKIAVAPRASWVTVEDVTAKWRDGGEGPPPPAAAVLVDGDAAAPAFVSDRWGRVTWANAAFSRAVTAGAGDDDDDEAVMVVVGAKDAKAVPAWGTCAGFSCRVRVRRGGGGSSLVAPCDVWRLDAAGGYLWRLDIQATLTLSLGGLL